MSEVQRVNLLETTDALVWAEEFVRVQAERPEDDVRRDVSIMVAWFANAFQAGRWAGEQGIARLQADLNAANKEIERLRAVPHPRAAEGEVSK